MWHACIFLRHVMYEISLLNYYVAYRINFTNVWLFILYNYIVIFYLHYLT